MRNGIEFCKNGNTIYQRRDKKFHGRTSYVVYINTLNGYKPSRSNPWDYLYNARRDSRNMYGRHEI